MYVIKKIYYDNATGERIWDNSYNHFITVDFDHDYETVFDLNNRVKESIGLLILENGQYEQDFAESNGYRVNVETKTLEFSYPDPNAPAAELVFERPLTDQVKELKTQTQQLNQDFIDLSDYVTTL